MAVSCGVLVFNPKSELLLGHATRSARWDIPKGMAEAQETPIAAAMREVAEETGLQLTPDALLEVGRFSYLRGKDLELFAVVVEGLDPAACVCTSSFRDASAMEHSEFDAFRWVPWNELPRLCGRSLALLLAQINPQSLFARCQTVHVGSPASPALDSGVPRSAGSVT
jgi:8-oxo-dGTP pyrophosphatase MutT (NUDIX family)